VVAVGKDEDNLLIIDSICRQFELSHIGHPEQVSQDIHPWLGGLGQQEGLASRLSQCPGPAKDFWGPLCPIFGIHDQPLQGGLPWAGPGAIRGWKDRGKPYLKEWRDVLAVHILAKL
jgi:hypothetical protein